MTPLDDDRELTIEELREVLARDGTDASLDDARKAHVALYGEPVARARLLARKDWSAITPYTFGKRFPMVFQNAADECAEVVNLCDAIRAGLVNMDVFGILARPTQLFTKDEGYEYRNARGKEQHRAACMHTFRWFSRTFPAADVRMEGWYDGNGTKYDVGSKSQKIGVECGYTQVGKLNGSLRDGWTIISVPYHLPEGLVAFRFTPLNVAGLREARAERFRVSDAKRKAEAKQRLIDAGHTMPIRCGTRCSPPILRVPRSECVSSAACDGAIPVVEMRQEGGALLLTRPDYRPFTADIVVDWDHCRDMEKFCGEGQYDTRRAAWSAVIDAGLAALRSRP